MYKWIDYIIWGLVQYSQSPSWLHLFYIATSEEVLIPWWCMYTTMVSQTWSDYTYWRESRRTHQLFSKITLAWTPFWAAGFGVLCYIGGSQVVSYSGEVDIPISLLCWLTRATQTQCHIVQQLYGRIRQKMASHNSFLMTIGFSL